MTLIEVEGAHTLQETYKSIDLHLGQSIAVLVHFHAHLKDYYIVVSTRLTRRVLTSTGILRYAGSNTPASGPLPIGPTDAHWSIKQARNIR